MPETPKTLSADQLDKMSPDERAKAFRERIVTDEAAIPTDFRDTLHKRARSLGDSSPTTRNDSLPG